MAKYYLYEKVVDAILSPIRLEKFSNYIRAHSGQLISVVATSDDQCSTHNDYWSDTSIRLGRNFYKTAWSQADKIEVKDISEKYKHIAQTYVGVFYHEVGHVFYTDMDYAFTILRTYKPAFREFAQLISNILEDVTIESQMKRDYEYTVNYLDVLSQIHTRDEAIQAVSNAIESQPNEAGTLITFLLLLSRGYDVSLLPKYSLYEDNKEFIKWGAVMCINTDSAKLRHKRQIAYAAQLCKILNLEEPDKKDVEDGRTSDGPDGPEGPSNSRGTGAIKRIIDTYSKSSHVGEYSNTRFNTRDTDKDLVDEDLKEQKASHPEPSEDSNIELNDINNSDLTKANVTMLANDEPVSRYTHRAERLDAFCGTSQYLKEYDYYVNKHKNIINTVVSLIRKLKAMNTSGWKHYQTSGKFDISTCYKQGNWKFFKQKKAPSPESDLVVEILVDNSGSMSGTKSKLAGEALITFAEALNRLHIPFAVDAFTEGNSCITIKLKEFTDDYNKVKTNMTLFTEQFHCSKLSTFCGNIDEVNLRYVRDVLMEQPHRDKMCIVISDGATCGDWKTLKKVADNMEASGILVLGIGIWDRNVEQIYKNNIVLRDSKDLEKLAGFLNEYLVKHIFK